MSKDFRREGGERERRVSGVGEGKTLLVCQLLKRGGTFAGTEKLHGLGILFGNVVR